MTKNIKQKTMGDYIPLPKKLKKLKKYDFQYFRKNEEEIFRYCPICENQIYDMESHSTQSQWKNKTLAIPCCSCLKILSDLSKYDQFVFPKDKFNYFYDLLHSHLPILDHNFWNDKRKNVRDRIYKNLLKLKVIRTE